MQPDPELEGLVHIIEHQLQKGALLKDVLLTLEQQGFDHEKIKQATLIAEEEKQEKKTFWESLVNKFHSHSIFKPLLIYIALQALLMILVFLFLSAFLQSYFHVDLGNYVFPLIIFCILGLALSAASLLIDSYLLHYIASFFVKDFENNTYKTSLWIIFWARIAPLYFIFVIILSFKAHNALLLIFITYVLMGLLIYALVAFFYVLSFGKAFLLVLFYALAKFFLDTIFYILFNLLFILLIGVSIYGKSLFG